MTAARMTAGIRADRNVRINVRHASRVTREQLRLVITVRLKVSFISSAAGTVQPYRTDFVSWKNTIPLYI